VLKVVPVGATLVPTVVVVDPLVPEPVVKVEELLAAVARLLLVAFATAEARLVEAVLAS
jgi:hypothetical protein